MKKHKNFIGVFPRDCLNLKIKDKPVGLIANTDKKDQKGEHWIAIYVDEYKSGEYFDSFGLPPLQKEFIEFLDFNCSQGWIFNSCTIQHFQSKKCGNFCIAYLKSRFNGQSFGDFISQFSVNLSNNDRIVKEII